MGWIGTVREVTHYLATVGADKNEQDEYALAGPESRAPATFMGLRGPDAEIVIPDEVCYYVDGEKRALAGGLATTSMGLSGIVVI